MTATKNTSSPILGRQFWILEEGRRSFVELGDAG